MSHPTIGTDWHRPSNRLVHKKRSYTGNGQMLREVSAKKNASTQDRLAYLHKLEISGVVFLRNILAAGVQISNCKGLL